MKTIRKTLTISLIFVLFFLLTSNSVSAVEPTFSFYPKGGVVVNKNNGFIVDVLINTAGQEIVSAKFTILFDPEILRLRKAERNNTLFEQYPEDESSTDNENGVIMLSGFTQSGEGATLYRTGEKSDIFARFTFDVLKEGEAILDWEYVGTGTTFDTVMLRDGSPPISILTSKPEQARFIIGDVILDPSTVRTSVTMDQYILVTGLVLILFGAFIMFTKPRRIKKNKGTVLVYDE